MMAKKETDPAELIEKALLVQNLKSLGAALQMSDFQLRDKLTIHFQRKRNHGGDVREVIYPLNSLKEDAIVIFADAKDMLSAAQHEHVFRSHPLMVRRLPPVFTSVQAKIDPLYFNIMPVDASFSKLMANLTNIEVDKSNVGKISCSHPSQLKLVESKVCGLVMNHAQDSVSSEDDEFEAPGASSLGFESRPFQRGLEEHGNREDDEMEVADENEERRTTGSLSKQSDEPEDFMGDHSTPKMQLASAREERDNKPEEKQTSALNNVAFRKTDVNNIGRFKTSDNLVVLDKFTYAYLTKFEDAALSKLLRNNKVQIQVVRGNTSEVLEGFIIPSSNKTSALNVSKAKDEFIAFYQKLHYGIARKAIDCSSVDAASIGKATEEILRQFKADTLITKVDGSPHLCLILRRGDVEEVARQFRKIAGIKSGKTLRYTVAGVHGSEATSTDLYKSTRFGKDKSEVHSPDGQQNRQQPSHNPRLKSGSLNDDMHFTTNEGMHIDIRTGDITIQSATAVVSPSDLHLINEVGGVAKAIMDAAGPESRSYCRMVMKTRQQMDLQITECIVTPAFNLKYNAVIHVGGPTNPHQQQFSLDLYNTFLSCLRTAENNSFSSLAIPLIGSGSIGAPKKDCANSLAEALIDFSRELGGPKFVREVFLVNIDKYSSTAIQQSLQMAFSLQHHAASPYRSSSATSEMGFPQSTIGDVSRPGIASHSQSTTPGRLSDEQSKPGGSHAPVKTDHQSIGKAPERQHQYPEPGESQVPAEKDQHGFGMQLRSQQHWPKLGESQGHGKKDQHDFGKQLRSQNLTAGEPTPGESEGQVKQSHKCSSDGNAGDTEGYGNRRASLDVNPADKSKGSTGGTATDDEAYGNRPACHNANPADKPVRSSGDHDGALDEKQRAQSVDDKTEDCAICLADKMTDPITLKCKHQFCKVCIEKAFKNSYKCPVCQTVCRPPKGNQPKGTMKHLFSNYWHLSGYEKDGIITIQYQIPSGTQSADHPNPGKHFTGTSRTAYLPDNQEGREVLGLLKKAFDAGLVFTVGQSVTSGLGDTVTWNDIHHKTSMSGGPQNHGYPDPDYMKRVKDDLAAKGIH